MNHDMELRIKSVIRSNLVSLGVNQNDIEKAVNELFEDIFLEIIKEAKEANQC